MTRRKLVLKSMPVLVVAAMVAGCAGQNQAQLQSDVQLLVAGAQAVVGALQAIPGIAADVIAQAQAALTDIQNNAAQIASNFLPGSAVAQAFSTAIATLAALVMPYFPVSTTWAAVVQALITLGTEVASVIGAQPPAVSTAQASHAIPMTVPQARQVLHQATGK